MSEQRELISVESFAEGLNNNYLACRELGHVWRPHTATYDNHSHTYDRVLRCTRCKTERVQVMTELGHIISNNYRYATGYQAKYVEPGHYSRDVFRIEAVTRYIGK